MACSQCYTTVPTDSMHACCAGVFLWQSVYSRVLQSGHLAGPVVLDIMQHAGAGKPAQLQALLNALWTFDVASCHSALLLSCAWHACSWHTGRLPPFLPSSGDPGCCCFMPSVAPASPSVQAYGAGSLTLLLVLPAPVPHLDVHGANKGPRDLLGLWDSTALLAAAVLAPWHSPFASILSRFIVNLDKPQVPSCADTLCAVPQGLQNCHMHACLWVIKGCAC